MSYLKNHKLLLLVIGVLLLANIGLLWNFVWKKPGAAPARPPREDARTRMIREVGLSTAQVVVYDSLRKIHYESIGPMFESLRKNKDSLFKLMHQPEVADSLIEKQSAAVYEMQQAIDLKIHRYFRSVRDLCSEEQKPKMDTFLKDLGKRMAGGRHWGPGGQKPERKKN